MALPRDRGAASLNTQHSTCSTSLPLVAGRCRGEPCFHSRSATAAAQLLATPRHVPLHRPGTICRRRIGVARCAPVYNPQNVPDPLVMPSPSFSPEEAVRAQLDALRNNDEPWVNHGIQTAYEFALDAGGMDRSYYFGFSKDLYHFDHFLGMFGNRLGALVSNSSYELSPAVEAAPGVVSVTATVHDGSGQSLTYKFELAKRELGRKKGSWMVKSLIPVP